MSTSVSAYGEIQWSAEHTDADVLIAIGATEKDLKNLYSQYSIVDEVRCG